MSKGNTTENETLDAILRAVDPTWRGNANRYFALHTADPGEAGDQTTNECAYTSYARVSVTAATGFSAAAGGSSSNTGLVQHPEATGGTETATHFSLGTAASGAGQILYSGALNSPRNISNGIQPQYGIGAAVFTED